MSDIIETLKKLIDLLQPLKSEERTRVIKTALTFLDDSTDATETSAMNSATILKSDTDQTSYHPKVNSWIKQNSINPSDLKEVFHFDDDNQADLIAQVPGKSNKEKTLNVYILKGIAQFILTAVPKFDDKDARKWCEAEGCYDNTNHSKTMKEKGSDFTGSKENGWVLTTPGLRKAADLIKQISGSIND